MKKKEPDKKRLVLRTERLRVLANQELGVVAGGTSGTCKSTDESCTKTV